MIHVIINEHQGFETVLMDCLTQFLSTILLDFKKENFEVNLVLCSDQYIRSMNRKYRKIDSATDVLSFSMQEEEEDFFNSQEPDGYTEPEILGDIIISTEQVKKQAREYGVTEEEELARLAIHGLLHLLGFDHERSAEDEMTMLERQDAYLDRFLKSYSH